MPYTIYREKGATLTELLISLVISLLLTLAFIQTLFIVKNISLKQQGLSIIQENARALHHMMDRAIKQNGNLICNTLSDEISLSIQDDVGLNVELLPHKGKPTMLRGRKVLSDILWVKYLKKAYPAHLENNIIVIQGHPQWRKNRILALTDCRHATFFRLTNDIEKINRSQSKISLSKNIPQPNFTMISRFHSVLYYVAETNRVDKNNQIIKALYSTDLNGKTSERIEGVEEFKVEYGMIGDKAVTVKIKCLLNSIEPVKVEKENRVLRQWWTWEWALPHPTKRGITA